SQPVTITNCAFGTNGANTTADISLIWNTTVFMSRVELTNCVLDSPTEFEYAGGNISENWVRSRRHDGVPGLTRIFGDYRNQQSEWYTYDRELYTGSGDANTQKVIEFAPTNYSSNYVQQGYFPDGMYVTYPGGFSGGAAPNTRYRFSQVGTTLTITGTPTAPTIVRAVPGANTTYGFYVYNDTATYPTVVMDNVEFSDLSPEGLCLGGYPRGNADFGYISDIIITTFQNITFRNNSRGGTAQIYNGAGWELTSYHLTVGVGGAITLDGLSFDSSTARDVCVQRDGGTATNLTLTNWRRQRATPTDQVFNSSTITWQAYGINYTSNGTGGGNWDVATTWSPNNVPTINDTVTILATDNVTINDTDAFGTPIIALCRAITNSGMLIFNGQFFGLGNATLQMAPGGAFTNNLNVRIQDGTEARIETNTTATTTPLVFTGNDIGWGLNSIGSATTGHSWRLARIDYRPATMNLTGANPFTVTFADNIWTYAVNVDRGKTLIFNPSATTATWVATGGNINVGTGATAGDGVLQIIGEANQGANLKLNGSTNGQVGLIVQTNGAITCTGASTTNRNATISSQTAYMQYIVCQSGSFASFRNSELFNLGYVPSVSPTSGLTVQTVDGSQSGQFFLLDNCTLHDMYRGVELTSCSNLNAT
ncbi:MAG: hypothetical protein AB1599_10740, partial [Planctomycetota bacterium]